MRVNLPFLTHDRGRYYVRRRGWPRKIRLHGTPGSPDFLTAYHLAVRALEKEAGQVENSTPRRDTLSWLCQAYYRSAEFKRLASSTKSTRRNILDRACQLAGDLPYGALDATAVRARRDALADRPESANGFLKAMRALYGWAIEAGHATHNPARQVPRVKVKSDGFHTWTTAEVAAFVARHPVGTKAHLALCLLLYTGARRSDVVRLGRQMIRRDWLVWTVQKTGKEHSVPILPELRAVIDATPSGHLTFLVTEFGKPFTAAGFGNWFRDRCNEAGLPQCSAHGLRKAGATIAAEHGATEHALMAIYGWASPKQAAVYTKDVNRRSLAEGSMRLIRLDD